MKERYTESLLCAKGGGLRSKTEGLIKMYLHVGNNQNIRERNIIGIFDADTATVSAITKKYLSAADARRAVEFASEEIPKSFVLYKDRDGNFKVCFSQLATSSLVGRSTH